MIAEASRRAPKSSSDVCHSGEEVSDRRGSKNQKLIEDEGGHVASHSGGGNGSQRMDEYSCEFIQPNPKKHRKKEQR